MSYALAFRVSFVSILKVFFLFGLLTITVCENHGYLQSDYFMNQEVADFQNWLHDKISNHEIEIPHTTKPLTDLQENTQLLHQVENLTGDDYDKSLEESGDFSYDDVQEEPLRPKSNERQQLATTDIPQQLDPLLKRKNSTGQPDLLHRNDGGTDDVRSALEVRETNQHAVKEILYIRESDSDLTGSLADFLQEALSPKEPSHKSIAPKQPDSESGESLSTYLNKALTKQLPPDTCSATNHSFYDRQTCSSSPRYRLEPHLSATFSEDLKSQMLERYSSNQNPDQIVCGFRRRMRPDKDVTQRALCPFQWMISKRNESRIPEYLYEAKCFCLDACAELKSKIRVLWRVGCEDGFHVYREGWEEITVACVPTKPPITNSKRAFVVQLPTPT